MVFSKKNAGKWVASKNGRVVASAQKLPSLLKRMDGRKDMKHLRFDLVPSKAMFVG